MRKIEKSHNVPATLVNAPVPTSAAEVRKDIYKADDVRSQLMTDQGRKCAYCECRVRTAYNDVEHYRPKAAYYWLGHVWRNLLYSCNECNRTYKKHHFPLRDESARDLEGQDISREEPLIVNPVEDEPSVHIKFRRYMAVACSDKGAATIGLFQLNGRSDLVEDRKQLYESYLEEQKKMNFAQQLLSSPSLPQEFQDNVRKILEACQRSITSLTSPTSPHSGMLLAHAQI